MLDCLVLDLLAAAFFAFFAAPIPLFLPSSSPPVFSLLDGGGVAALLGRAAGGSWRTTECYRCMDEPARG